MINNSTVSRFLLHNTDIIHMIGNENNDTNGQRVDNHTRWHTMQPALMTLLTNWH